jgi:hypothetical protein
MAEQLSTGEDSFDRNVERWSRTTNPKPPLNFAVGVSDDRVWYLMVRVWRRLPAHERAVLRALVSDVLDGRSDNPEGILGSVGPIDPDTMQDGIAAKVAENLTFTVSLGQAREIKSDAACMYVIAHEFAHAVLRHNQTSVVVSTLFGFGEPYGDAEVDQLHEWHEDDADLQAWVWGFQDELKAFLEEFPESRRPRWYVELQYGGEPTPEEVAQLQAKYPGWSPDRGE